MVWKNLFLPVLLAVFAWYDIRTREFPFWLAGCGGGAAILYTIFVHPQYMQSALGGVLLGGILVAVSLFGGAIGVGDGILFMITGLCLGFSGNLFLLFLSSIFAAAAAIILLRCGRSRKAELPFAPFVCTASVVQLVLQAVV